MFTLQASSGLSLRKCCVVKQPMWTVSINAILNDFLCPKVDEIGTGGNMFLHYTTNNWYIEGCFSAPHNISFWIFLTLFSVMLTDLRLMKSLLSKRNIGTTENIFMDSNVFIHEIGIPLQLWKYGTKWHLYSDKTKLACPGVKQKKLFLHYS